MFHATCSTCSPMGPLSTFQLPLHVFVHPEFSAGWPATSQVAKWMKKFSKEIKRTKTSTSAPAASSSAPPPVPRPCIWIIFAGASPHDVSICKMEFWYSAWDVLREFPSKYSQTLMCWSWYFYPTRTSTPWQGRRAIVRGLRVDGITLVLDDSGRWNMAISNIYCIHMYQCIHFRHSSIHQTSLIITVSLYFVQAMGSTYM